MRKVDKRPTDPSFGLPTRKQKSKPKVQLRDLQRTRYMYNFLLGANNGSKFIKITHIK